MTNDHASRRGVAVVLSVVTLLTFYNVLVNEVLPNTFDGVAAATTTAVLYLAARSLDLTVEDLGLELEHVGRGLRWGLGFSGLAVTGVVLLAIIPSTRANFDDSAFVDRSSATVWWELLVRIPSVTAGFEEFAFRGVLLAALMRLLNTSWAVGIQAVLFGFWHILPTLSPGTPWRDVAVAVGFTAVTGVFFGVIRLRSRSLLAPLLVHATTNGVTYATAWIVTTRML